MSVLDTRKPINQYFEDISRIPRGSYHEEEVANYVEKFAIEHHLKYQRDKMHNIIIFKEASLGYEDHETVMLQGHLDMVNEKNNDSSHDFDCDPLTLYEKDGFLHANGTTLGADDGVAICYMLSILGDEKLKHPPLECVFTVQEEVGLFGAAGLDMSSMQAKRMIGLDCGSEGETCTSSSGGRDVLLTMPVHFVQQDLPSFTIEIKGLQGGHSGECINKGRGNANKLMSRLLFHLLQKGVDVRLSHIQGGLKRNAIPRECVVTFVSQNSYEDISTIIQTITTEITQELENSDPGIKVEIKNTTSHQYIHAKESEALIMMMYLAKNGCIEESQVIKDLPIISLNMGVVTTEKNAIVIHYSIRSPLKSYRDEFSLQLQTLGHFFGASVERTGDYPGWNYDPNSLLRKQMKDFYKQWSGNDLKEVATHGGLETGIFKAKIPELDIITMGPNMYDIHTPQERLEISSYEQTYDLLVAFLKTL